MTLAQYVVAGITTLMLNPATTPLRAQVTIPRSDSLQLSGRSSLGSCLNQFTRSRIESTKAGYRYWFIGETALDGRTLKMSVVKPHSATHPPHSHAEDEIFFILEGTAELFLNGETSVVHPYASFYCPPKSEHGIRNVGDTELKYLVIKTYARN